MSRSSVPLFVERRTYRRRRMVDAARMMPLLGVGLFFLPLFWKAEDGSPASTVWVMVYLFAIWAGLAILSGVVARLMAVPDEDQVAPMPDEAG